MKKIETSKLILLVDFGIAILLLVVVICGTFFEKDVSQVTAISAGWDAQLAVAVGFYFWKARSENKAKGVQQLIKDLADKYGIEAVTTIAELIFKD